MRRAVETLQEAAIPGTTAAAMPSAHGIPALHVRTHIRAGAAVTTEETTPPPTTTATATATPCTAA